MLLKELLEKNFPKMFSLFPERLGSRTNVIFNFLSVYILHMKEYKIFHLEKA